MMSLIRRLKRFPPSGGGGPLSKVKSWEEQGQSWRWIRQHVFLPFKSHRDVGGATVWCHWPSPVSASVCLFLSPYIHYETSWLWLNLNKKADNSTKKKSESFSRDSIMFSCYSLCLFSFHWDSISHVSELKARGSLIVSHVGFMCREAPCWRFSEQSS